MRARENARSLGAFYTGDLSAMMLARLAIPGEYPDKRPYKVGDPACGDGALLVAVVNEWVRRGWPLGDLWVWGADVAEDACEHAHAALLATGLGPEQVRIDLMPHGPQPDGSVKAGALELLAPPAKPSQLVLAL